MVKISCECGEKGELEDTGKEIEIQQALGLVMVHPLTQLWRFKLLACDWCGRQALFYLFTEKDDHYEL